VTGHQCATPAATLSSINRPARKRSRPNCSVSGLSPLAMSSAKPQPDPGMALNPPVPQPQLIKVLPNGVLLKMGERSPVTSTIPPQCRSIFKRDTMGKVSINAGQSLLDDEMSRVVYRHYKHLCHRQSPSRPCPIGSYSREPYWP